MVGGESVRDRFGTSGRRIDRSSENRVKRWILFDGDRQWAATVLLGTGDRQYREEIDRLQSEIHSNTEEVLTTLSRVPGGSTDELLTGLSYDSSWQLYQARCIPTEYGDQLTATEREVIEDITLTLRKLMVCRE
jgi:hypothetical protein